MKRRLLDSHGYVLALKPEIALMKFNNSNLITQTLWLLAKSSSAQAKLRKEVSKIMAINPRPNYGALREMEWLDCVVWVVISFRYYYATDIVHRMEVCRFNQCFGYCHWSSNVVTSTNASSRFHSSCCGPWPVPWRVPCTQRIWIGYICNITRITSSDIYWHMDLASRHKYLERSVGRRRGRARLFSAHLV